ncbi:MAG TPA: chemotaxis response regulator protein-glutamate methylesterase [Candidatus Angelobacter sp.]|jgi:two-component system, chemotaxis family, protein-glutamate methylesterase/glutaminase|nr:chemotaxis response regulator protein-glutamate methylesterase [Candidatus Angelobacter sp.]
MAVSKPIRVLVVDDSAFMRKVLQGIIATDPQLQVCGEARDGRDALAQLESLKPDVISMDINMPHMDGLEATEVIMSSNPHPVVIVSSESRDGAEVTLKALQLGAIDFVAKPSSGIDFDMSSVKDELCRKLKMAAKVRVVRTAARANSQPKTAIREQPAQAKAEPAKPAARPLSENGGHRGAGKFPIVVVASSTGGPATLMKLIPEFPADFPGAVIVVQHMPGNFTSQFSKQLGEVSAMKVKEAEAGEIVVPGQVYVCPGANHLRVSATGRIVLDDGPRIGGYRPCADLTIESVVAYCGANAVAVILTGMGNDGSKGVQSVRAAGGHVIAQDESTAVIFGMPQEAIKTGAVDQVLPIDGIFSAVEKRVMSHSFMRAGALS